MSSPTPKKAKTIPSPLSVPDAPSTQSDDTKPKLGTPLTASPLLSPSIGAQNEWQRTRELAISKCAKISGRPTDDELQQSSHLYSGKEPLLERTLEKLKIGETNSMKMLARATHLDSSLLLSTQCFLVSAKKMVTEGKGKESHLLGDMVMFQKRNCSEEGCVKCDLCGVCPHMYKCSCNRKLDGEWCLHLHRMHRLTNSYFLHSALLYVNSNWKLTEMQHIRAFVQGPDHMVKRDDGYWHEEIDFLKFTKRYKVKEIPEDENCTCAPDRVCDLCNACLCRYICNCEDNGKYKQVCEHIHNVAMQKHEKRTYLFTTLEKFGSQYKHSTTEHDYHRRYYIEQEHDMSAPEYFECDFKAYPPNSTWIMKFKSPFITHATVTLNPESTKKCECGKPGANPDRRCERCNICEEHYKCTCEFSKFTICRHIHRVVRENTVVKESSSSKFEHILKLLKLTDTEKPEGPLFRIPQCREPLEIAKAELEKLSLLKLASKLEELHKEHLERTRKMK